LEDVLAEVMGRKERREIAGTVDVQPSVDRLERLGTWNAELVAYLRACIEMGRSVLISGEEGAGKSALLSTLTSFVPDARLVSVEPAPKLETEHDHVVRLQGTSGELLDWALGLAADWLLVDEVLPEMALALLQALAAVPVMGTIGGTSARNALGRLVQWVIDAAPGMAEELVRRLIADHVDVVVNVARLYEGTHRITEILEVLWDDEMGGDIHTQTLVALDAEGGLAVTGFESAFVSGGISQDMPRVEPPPAGPIAGPVVKETQPPTYPAPPDAQEGGA
jgi:pilus assembly protein CpaF